jgi:hypothetical protein
VPSPPPGDGPVDENEFVEAVAPLVEVISKLTSAAAALFDRSQPAADSRAMSDLASESKLADDQWPEPVLLVHSQISFATFALLDHLRSFGRLFADEPVPVYSHFVIARAALDVGGIAWWLLDSSIDVEARVVRGQVVRLVAARELRRAPRSLVAAHQRGEAREAEIREGARRRGWTVSGRNARGPVRLRDQEHPKPRSAIRAVLGHEDHPTLTVGDTLWWLLSGHTHGGMHALMQSMTIEPTNSPLEPPMAAIGTQASTTHVLGGNLCQMFVRVIDARAAYIGRTSDEWIAAKATCQEYLRAVIAAGDLTASTDPA